MHNTGAVSTSPIGPAVARRYDDEMVALTAARESKREVAGGLRGICVHWRRVDERIMSIEFARERDQSGRARFVELR